MTGTSVVLILAVTTAACSSPEIRGVQELPAAAEVRWSVPLEAPTHTYQLLTPEMTTLALGFDDGQRTYFIFQEAVPDGLMLFDENGQPVSFTMGETSGVVDALHVGWLLRTPTVSSYAQARDVLRVAGLESASRGSTVIEAPLPEDLAAVRAEILAAEHRLAGVRGELWTVGSGRPVRSMSMIRHEIEQIQTQLDGVEATLVRAHFASGSAVLHLSPATRQALIDAAVAAESVRIHGDVDSDGSRDLNARLALDRGEAVKRLLLEGGVDEAKILTIASINDFVASNATAAGRAQNRRVDVLLVGGDPTGGRGALRTRSAAERIIRARIDGSRISGR